MQPFKSKSGDNFAALMRAKPRWKAGLKERGIWHVVARSPDGRMKWEDWIYNLVVNDGLDHMLDVELSAATQVTIWYLGLTDGTPTVAAGDTMASHVGWVEVQAYSEGTRVTWVEAGVSGQSIDNSASPATFTINADTTVIGGAFLTSSNVKGGGVGFLYAAGAFTTGDKSLDTNDTIDVTATFTAADDGV